MSDNLITFANVSRFYGEVLGVNKVSLAIPPGITSLVGPNGSGKTTLMNLMTGLIRPSQGEIQRAGHVYRRPRTPLPRGGLLRAVRHLPQGPHRLPVHLLVPARVRHELTRSATSAPWPRSKPSA